MRYGLERFEPAPLLALARLQAPGAGPNGLVTDGELAVELGVHIRSIQRWKLGAQLCAETADRCAIRLGYHPVEIWPHFADNVDDTEDVVA